MLNIDIAEWSRRITMNALNNSKKLLIIYVNYCVLRLCVCNALNDEIFIIVLIRMEDGETLFTNKFHSSYFRVAPYR